MRVLLLLLIFFGSLFFTPVLGQSHYKDFKSAESMKVGAIADYSSYFDSYHTMGAGLNLEASGRWIGASYSGLLGIDSEGNFYAYTGVGQVAGVYLLKHNVIQSDVIGVLAILGILVPETIFFNTYPTDVSRLSFYISPWGVEYRGGEPWEKETKVSIEAGVKLAVKVRRDFYIEPFAGVKAIYKTERRGFSAGVNFFFESL